MGNEQSVPAMRKDVEVEEEVQKLKKELKTIKKEKSQRNEKKVGRERETEGGN